MTMTGNQKSIGVPEPVHARAAEFARRDGIRVWEVIAEALDYYDRLKSPRNGKTPQAPHDQAD